MMFVLDLLLGYQFSNVDILRTRNVHRLLAKLCFFFLPSLFLFFFTFYHLQKLIMYKSLILNKIQAVKESRESGIKYKDFKN